MRVPDGPSDEETYLTTVEVAKRYRVEPSTVRYWRHKGYGPEGERVGKKTLYSLAACRRWDRARRAGADERGAA